MSMTCEGGVTGSKVSVCRKCSRASIASALTSSPRSMGPVSAQASLIPPLNMDRKYVLLASKMRLSATMRSLLRPAINSTVTREPLAALFSHCTRRMSAKKVDSRVSTVSAVKMRKGTVQMRNIIRPSGVTPYVSMEPCSMPRICRVATSYVVRSIRQKRLSLSRTYAKFRVSTGRFRCVKRASVPKPSRLPADLGWPAMHSTVRS
mmetsp:Transcript_136209/g.236821  ORF Transcript_136209/g.236821 Transcript_136209/m.236821 type:complete len:206 (+) Transcript_136209:466-1083(+)